MEQIKEWFLYQAVNFGLGILFLISIILAIFLWYLCEYLGEKKWHIIIKIILALVILVVANLVGGMLVATGLRNVNIYWVEVAKNIVSGVIFPLVFIKIIPGKGKGIALFLIGLLAIFSLYVGYITFKYVGWEVFAPSTLLVAPVTSVAYAIIFYFIFSKSES